MTRSITKTQIGNLFLKHIRAPAVVTKMLHGRGRGANQCMLMLRIASVVVEERLEKMPEKLPINTRITTGEVKSEIDDFLQMRDQIERLRVDLNEMVEEFPQYTPVSPVFASDEERAAFQQFWDELSEREPRNHEERMLDYLTSPMFSDEEVARFRRVPAEELRQIDDRMRRLRGEYPWPFLPELDE